MASAPSRAMAQQIDVAMAQRRFQDLYAAGRLFGCPCGGPENRGGRQAWRHQQLRLRLGSERSGPRPLGAGPVRRGSRDVQTGARHTAKDVRGVVEPSLALSVPAKPTPRSAPTKKRFIDPPRNREENHNIQDVFTQPGSFATGSSQLTKDELDHLCWTLRPATPLLQEPRSSLCQRPGLLFRPSACGRLVRALPTYRRR
jgi:hypothetical protein